MIAEAFDLPLAVGYTGARSDSDREGKLASNTAATQHNSSHQRPLAAGTSGGLVGLLLDMAATDVLEQTDRTERRISMQVKLIIRHVSAVVGYECHISHAVCFRLVRPLLN